MSRIDWNQINVDSESAWQTLADQLASDARAALARRNETQLADVMDQILDYAGHPSPFKPASATATLNDLQVELALAKAALANDRLEAGNAALDDVATACARTSMP